jgi:hypothetical protein
MAKLEGKGKAYPKGQQYFINKFLREQGRE